MKDLLADPKGLATYNVLLISCSPNIWSSYSAAERATIVKNLGDWVNLGGRMVATDHSYDYVAQTFPGAISWQGPAGPPWAIGTLMGTGANVGLVPSGGSTQATINDKNLTSWLLLPQVGVTTAPQVSISGWLKPWSVQASVPTTTTSLVHGSVDWQPTGGAMMTSDLPLTSELTVNKCGRVVYSSYHTLSSVNAASLSAQERILEYLLLDAASCGHTAG